MKKKLTILYFASLRELVNTAHENLETHVEDVDALKVILSKRGDNWHSAMLHNLNLLVTVNQQRIIGNQLLQDGDEVAFFPPVTGG